MPETRAFAFTDIVDSTGTKLRLGDPAYKEILDAHHARIRKLATGVVNTWGDSFFLKFESAVAAVTTCIEIQRSLSKDPISDGEDRLAIRIGIDMGDPIQFIEEDGRENFSGTTIDQAARFEGLAGPSQLLISERVQVFVKDRVSTYDWGLYFLKGAGSQKVFEVLWDDKAPTAPSGKRQHGKRRFLGPFVGRAKELAEIERYLSDPHMPLITLKGQGGIGKTRLADEIEHRWAQKFDDGIYFVELESTANSLAAVESQIRAECKIDTGSVAQFFQNKSAMLVLNNFESATNATSLVSALLHDCGGFRILATSQVPLRIPGEQIWTVESLTEPDAEAMFLKYSRRHDPNFNVRAGDQALLSDLLHLTGQVPFCLELAAAKVRPGRSLNAIVDGIGKSLRSLGAAEIQSGRHQSVTACLDWSFDLLSDAEKDLHPKLSIFQGGFLPQDVDAVCSTTDAGALLERLSDASMLRMSDDRYYMLPTALEYARDKLGIAASALRKRHAEHYLERLEEADSWIAGEKQHEGYAWLRAEFENCRAGIDWAIASNADALIVRYSHAFANSLATIGRAIEQLAFCQAGLQAAERIAETQGIAAAQNDLGIAYRNLSSGDRAENLGKAIACYEAALRVWTEGDYPRDWAGTQNNLGIAYRNLPSGDRAENQGKAIEYYEAALRVWTEGDYPLAWAVTQNNLGIAYQHLPSGDRAENLGKAIACYEAALRVRTERDYPLDWAMTQNNLGTAYQELPSGDRAENLGKAIVCYEAALRVRTEGDYPLQWAMTQNNLGTAYQELPSGDRTENHGKAIACYEAALRVRTERDYPSDWAMTQNNLGIAYANLPSGDHAENLGKAIAFYEAALRVRTQRDYPLDWADTQENLAATYERLPGNRKDNLRQAIPCWEAAIRGYRAVRMHEKADQAQGWLKQAQSALANLD